MAHKKARKATKKHSKRKVAKTGKHCVVAPSGKTVACHFKSAQSAKKFIGKKTGWKVKSR